MTAVAKDKVVVLAKRNFAGWDGGEDLKNIQAHQVMPILWALKRKYSTDAHFAPYFVRQLGGQVPTCVPRLNKPALQTLRKSGADVFFGVVSVDVDDEIAHANKTPARQQWRDEQDDIYGNLPHIFLDGMARYDTRGGYRLLWTLPKPLTVEQYVAFGAALREELRWYGVECDENCAEWNRLYRLPFVVRDGVKQNLDFDFDGLGPLRWVPEGGIVEAAPKVVSDAPPAPASLSHADETRLVAALQRIPSDTNETWEPVCRALHHQYEGSERGWQILDAWSQRSENYDEETNRRRWDSFAVGHAEPTTIGTIFFLAQKHAPRVVDEDRGVRIENTEEFRFRLGSEVEIAKNAMGEIEKEAGANIVADRTKLWRYAEPLGVWKELEKHTVDRIVHSFDGEDIYQGLKQNGEPKISKLKISNNICTGVAKIITSQKAVPDFFDGAEDGIVFRDQFVRVTKDGVSLEPVSPEHRQTDYLSFSFVPGARPARFLKMLRECWEDEEDVEDRIQLLREWVGAALCNKATQFQQGLILYGDGKNGKSTVQDIVTALFPRETLTAIAPQEMQQEYRRALLSRSRLNCVSELPEADILAAESIKAVIDGSVISGRWIREAVFSFRAKAAHLFSANSLPGVTDHSLGFWRRWIVLRFDRVFKDHEIDRNLAKDIVANELQDIASWVVEGAANVLQRGGYTAPKSAQGALEEWRHQADQVSAFVDQRCEMEGQEQATKLYNAYCHWAIQMGHRKMSSPKFLKRLLRLGVEKKRTKNGTLYGLSIKKNIALVI